MRRQLFTGEGASSGSTDVRSVVNPLGGRGGRRRASDAGDDEGSRLWV